MTDIIGTVEKPKVATSTLKMEDTLPSNVDTTNVTSDEWKTKFESLDKRFRDNQSFNQKQRNVLETKIQELEISTKEIPSTTEDLQALSQENPKLYESIVQIASKQTKEVSNEIAKLKKEQHQLKLEQQFKKLLEVHPDVDDIRYSADFDEWLEIQEPDVKSIPFNSDASLGMLDMVFTKYKRDMNVQVTKDTAKALDKQEQVLDSMSTGSTNSVDVSKSTEMLSTSQIHDMSSTEWQKNKEKIYALAHKGMIHVNT